MRVTGGAPAVPVTVAYIGGMGRSGSTLLARVLGQVPGVCQVGELCYLWKQSVLRDRLCSCGRAFSACPFWRQVGEAAFGGWDAEQARHADALRRRVERNRNVVRMAWHRPTPPDGTGRGAGHGPAGRRRNDHPAGRGTDHAGGRGTDHDGGAVAAGDHGFRRELDEYRALMVQVFAAVQTVSGCQVVVDNSKLPSSAYLLRGAPGVDLRVLHLVRSSHGVSYSWSKELAREDFDGQPMRRFSPSRSATEWLAYNAAFELLAALGVPRLLLHYEDFVADPRRWTVAVLDFLGVPAAGNHLAFLGPDAVHLDSDHGLWGNPMRVRVGRQPLRRDDAWRTGLPRRDRLTVTALSLPGLVRYGYLARRNARSARS